MTVDEIVAETITQVREKLVKKRTHQVPPKFVTLGKREFDALEEVWRRAGTDCVRRIEGLPYKQSGRQTGIRFIHTYK
jgi:hypothetical protein